MAKDKILILAVDRDDDVGRKTKYKGPVIGRKKCIEIANKLALADPTDSDSNTIFESVRLYDELKQKKDAEVAIITGDGRVGVVSDENILKNLDKVVKKTKKKRVVLVTDGAEDEHIIPIIQNKVEIISVNRVVVKQSENLEGMYYMIHDFIDNPKMSKIILGVPALALLSYSLFGAEGWRAILGLVGAYLLIKGFKLEGYIIKFFEDARTAFTKRRISFFFYIVAMVIFLIGCKIGYDFTYTTQNSDVMELLASFLKGSIYIIFLSFLTMMTGKIISAESKRKDVFRYTTLIAFAFGLTLVSSEAATVILMPEVGITGLFAYIVFGFFIVLISILFERKSS